MSTHHHSVGTAPARGVQLVARLYPRSSAWVLLAMMVSLLTQGQWSVLFLTAALTSILAWQTIRTDHVAHLRRRP